MPTRVPLLVALLPIACSSSLDPRAITVEERHVSPAVANAHVTAFTDDHIIWVPSASIATASRIILLLPGTGGAPANARMIGRVAAQQGYRAIGLMYPDARAVVTECAGDADVACMAKMREEIVEGRDLSPHVTVDAENSIAGRLADLLRHLAQTYPGEHWDTFLQSDGTVRWDAIAVSGLSQGGGHAAYIAKLHAVPRVVMFGAPADGYGGVKAPWMEIGATPADRYYGFRHARDPFLSIEPNWNALGLAAFGAAVDVTADTRDFRGSHTFTTDLLPASGSYADAHPSVYVDGLTPITGAGTPVFESLWRYVFGTPAEGG